MTAYTPNLPALLDALPADATRAPQESCAAASTPAGCCPQCAAPLPGAEPVPTSAEAGTFTRTRQVAFLENLSVTGSVRSAASSARVSHQTAYRARRASADFRLAWDAALVVARANAADVLACRAIDGVEEKVFYHGEEVATRTRYSDRLLLSHLARLDRMAETPLAGAFAEDFDAALAGFERGEAFAAPIPPETALAEPTPARGQAGPGEADHGREGPGFLSPGPCNTRSMSPAGAAPSEAPEEAADAPGDRAEDEDGDADYAHLDFDPDAPFDPDDWGEWGSPADHPQVTRGEGPGDAALPMIDRILAAMERSRPAGAAAAAAALHHAGDVEAWQMQAFMEGFAEWYRVIPPPPGEEDAGEWHLAA